LKYYASLYKEYFKERANDVFNKIITFVNFLPELARIKRVVDTKNYNKKDFFSIHLVLKIYENYFSIFVDREKYKLYIQTKIKFYANFSKEENKFLIEKINCDYEIKSILGKKLNIINIIYIK
jgi:hypothetical protein